MTRSPGTQVDRRLADAAAPPVTVATSSRGVRSSATSAVISFVIDAIGRRSRSSCEASTSPVPAFWTTYASRVDLRWRGGRDDRKGERRGESKDEGTPLHAGGHPT